tara:strand:- start:210 stop:1379 length:1170 start_codon:yes stop_codon:yes gene_type:complete
MSRRLLLQSILKFKEGIKSGTAKVQDIVEDYFKSSGKSVTDEDRAIIMNEFAETAPDNITPLIPPEGIMSKYKTATDDMTDAQKDATLSDFVAQSDRVYQNFVTKALIDLQNASKSDQQQMVKAIIERKGMFKYLEPEDAKKLLDSVDNPGAGTVETIAERLAADEGVDVAETILPTKPIGPKEEGISSLFPKGKRGEIFDIDNSKRDEAAEFIRKMRGADIKNKDIKKLFEETGGDIEQGKRAATTLARAADMSADTKIKQELLSELDEMKMDRPPRFFKDEKMGFYDMRGVLDDLTTTINNRIQDDLIEQGVPEETVDDIFFTIRDNIRQGSRSNLRNDPKALIAKIKDEIEMEGVTYDTDFWNKYVDEIMSLVSEPEPRFMYGGVV